MSDTNMEKRTNSDFCINAYGDIIIGGLGIGMIIMAIQDKPEVNTITVIEKNQEVIDLVASQLNFNDKVNIVCADVFEWNLNVVLNMTWHIWIFGIGLMKMFIKMKCSH